MSIRLFSLVSLLCCNFAFSQNCTDNEFALFKRIYHICSIPQCILDFSLLFEDALLSEYPETAPQIKREAARFAVCACQCSIETCESEQVHDSPDYSETCKSSFADKCTDTGGLMAAKCKKLDEEFPNVTLDKRPTNVAADADVTSMLEGKECQICRNLKDRYSGIPTELPGDEDGEETEIEIATDEEETTEMPATPAPVPVTEKPFRVKGEDTSKEKKNSAPFSRGNVSFIMAAVIVTFTVLFS
eukprot:Selendium_serpulae@DN6261_c4_g1_i16.p1